MNVTLDKQSKVAIVRICRPDRRNAVDGETAQQLADTFRAFDTDRSLSVAIFTGDTNAFCAGADLKAIASGQRKTFAANGDSPMGPARLRLSKPVIAAIEGPAVAGGLELVLWCDLRVAAEDAYFGVFNRRFGVPLVDLGTFRLPRLIGHSRAMDLILTGRRVDAKEALAIGLINRVVPKGAALQAALQLANQLAEFPQTAMRHDRLATIEQWDLTEQEAVANEIKHGIATRDSGETLSGATAFASGVGRHGA